MLKKTKALRTIVLNNVKVCYPNLFMPRTFNPKREPKYSMMLLIPKYDADALKKINHGIDMAVYDGGPRWGYDVTREFLEEPLRDGEVEKEGQEEFKNHYYINCSSKERPRVVDRKRRPILNPEEIYSGCYCNVSVVFYPYSEGTWGIGCSLSNVQKVRDGECLEGGTSPEEDFEILEDLQEEDYYENFGY